MSCVDVVVVTYNSREDLRPAVEPIADVADVNVIVVDNASVDGTLETVADLPVERIRSERNLGFSAGCNIGWRAGTAPYVLFLNPDARISSSSIRALAGVLATDPQVGIVGPLITHADGTLDLSQRRFPRAFSTYARAIFLHRFAAVASWGNELVCEPRFYETSRPVEWLSGACMLVRRDLLETFNGLDERFFMYCEDQDLCKAAWDAGYEVRFEPAASCLHVGGASAPRASLFPVAAKSRLLYAQKHSGRLGVLIEWFGLLLHAATHAVVSSGRGGRRGHLATLAALRSLPASAAKHQATS